MVDYVTGRIPMVSAIGDVSKRKFKKIVGKSGIIWLIGIQTNPADNIYMYNPKGNNSRGFAGRTLEFLLEDGSVEKAQGPWHSNSESLLKDTGIDIRDLHLTRVVLGTGGVEYQGGHSFKVKDVVYQEDDYQLGSYDRDKELAQEYADKLNKDIHGWVQSMGGGHGVFKKPRSNEGN